MAKAGQASAGGARAYPIQEVFSRLGIKVTKGYELIKLGPGGEPAQIETFTIGRLRYATEEAVQKFIRARLAEAKKETSEERARRVKPAVAARARQREAVAG